MMTSSAKYAVRASIALAQLGQARLWTSTAELAEAAGLPRKFLEAIMTRLRSHGLVESRRGPAGGHRLVDPARTSLADVLRVFDGPLALTPCASATRFEPCADCVDVEECRLRHVMQRARDAVASVLEQCSIADLAAAPEEQRRA